MKKLVFASAALLAASVMSASAQAPASGNVDPASPRAGSEQTGTGQTQQPNQPAPRAGTTGQGTRMAPGDRQNPGINANTNPGSKESGSESSGAEPAPARR